MTVTGLLVAIIWVFCDINSKAPASETLMNITKPIFWVWLTLFIFGYIRAKVIQDRHRAEDWLDGKRTLRQWRDVGKCINKGLFWIDLGIINGWGKFVDWVKGTRPPKWL